MEEGWNFEYFAQKMEQLQERLEKTTDAKIKEQIETDIELYRMLGMRLLFSTGDTICPKVTLKDFVNEICGQDFLHKIPLKEAEKMEQKALSFSKLPPLKIKQNHTHITVDDSVAIVGDFLQDKFGDEHYKLFKNLFINNKNYILFNEDWKYVLSSVIYLDKEAFVQIGKSEDIRMLCSIAHESGHLYGLVNRDQKEIHNLYGEYESFFCEFNLLLWLMENNIYKKEATNHFLSQFNLMERLLYMRYIIRNYKLNQIKTPDRLEQAIQQLRENGTLNITDNQTLFDTYSTAINMDLQMYFSSFLAVLNNIDDVNKYEQIVRNIKTGNESDIKVKMLNKGKGEYASYLKYRNFLQNSQ